VGWYCVVSIRTHHGLKGPGIKSRWGRGFPHLGPTQPSVRDNGYQVSLSWGTAMRRGVDHSPPPSAEVKEREQVYLYSTSGPLWTVPRWTLLYSYVNL